MNELKSLTLNGKKYDAFVDPVARENGNGSATSLSKKQINALDALFKAASYIKDASAEYAAFCDAFGLANPDEPSEDVVVQSVKLGSASYENNMLKISTGWDARAVLVPVGQYLKKGATYKFSLGGLSGTYNYGVQIMVAEAPGMAFPYMGETQVFSGVTERIVDTGYISSDFTYTVEQDNLIVAVNFKKSNDGSMGELDYSEILENFTIEETEPPEDEPSEDVVVQSVKYGSVSLNGSNIRLSTGWDARAVLVPIGQYLKKGATYKFSLGSVSGTYDYGVQIYGVDSAGYTFPYTDAGQTFPVTVTQIADDGYQTGEYTFTPDRDNCIFTVNFKKGNNESMGDADYDTICKNFTIEEVV